MPVEPYGGEMDLEGGWDYENRMVEPGYTPCLLYTSPGPW